MAACVEENVHEIAAHFADSEAGTVAVKRLLCSNTSDKDGAFASSAGIVPDNRFPRSRRTESRGKEPSDAGTVPDNFASSTATVVSKGDENSGKLPFSEVEEAVRTSKFCRSANEDGRDPDSSALSSRYLVCTRTTSRQANQ